METFFVLLSVILWRLLSEEIWPLGGFFTVLMIQCNLFSRDTLETKAPLMEVGLEFALYLSVKVFSLKVLIGDTNFTSLTGDGTAILRGHPRHANLHFLVKRHIWSVCRNTDNKIICLRALLLNDFEFSQQYLHKNTKYGILNFQNGPNSSQILI